MGAPYTRFTNVEVTGTLVTGTISGGEIGEDILVGTNKKVQFRDAGIYINSGADGKLTISADGTGTDDITIDGSVEALEDVAITGDLAVGGDLEVTGATSALNNVTVATGKTLAVTTADKLTVGGKIVPQTMEHSFAIADSDLATRYLHICKSAQKLVGLSAIWNVAESTATALTLSFSKDASTNAPGAGTGVVSATINLKGTARTVNNATLSTEEGVTTFASGNRLSMVISDAATELSGLVITAVFERV